MGTIEQRLRSKLSPLEDKKFTEKIRPLMEAVDFAPYERQYKSTKCVVLTPNDAWELLFPGEQYNLHELTVLGRSLQALLWERSYLRGNLVFTKTLLEIDEDGF